MAFKELASLDADTVIAIGKKDKQTGKPYPKQAEGYYLGNRTVENKRGESKIHFLQTPKGNLGLWGTTDLNRKLGSAPLGAMVRVTSTGTKPTPNGDMYTYKVEVDADNAIEVSAMNDAAAPAEDSLEDTDNEDDSYEEETAEVDQETVSQRSAKVQEMLNRRSAKSAKA